MTERAGFILDPLDVLFFRDGRPFEAGTHARSGLPFPQTFAGALRTWLLTQAGCDFDRLGRAIKSGATFSDAIADGQPSEAAAVAHLTTRGPWLALLGNQGAEPLVAMPATLHARKDGSDEALIRSDPLRTPLPGWAPEFNDELPVWPRTRARTQPARGWLRSAGLHAFLEGGVPAPSDVIAGEHLFALDHRTGIEIDAGRGSASEGRIYSAALLALRPELRIGTERLRVLFYAEATGPKDLMARFGVAPVQLALGGEARRVAMYRVEPFAWPGVAPAHGRQPLLLLTSPGLFDAGWRPAQLDCVAAVVPEPIAVSGWDLARGGPKPTRFAAPAGSVYFARDIPAGFTGSLGSPGDAALGYGTTLIGSWQHV